MAEYIEKDKAKELVCEFCTWVGTSNCEECEHPVDDVPSADVAPVRHGRWIDKPGGTYQRMQSWCSVCGKRSGIGGIESNRHKPYCPNCGAKMDGKSRSRHGTSRTAPEVKRAASPQTIPQILKEVKQMIETKAQIALDLVPLMKHLYKGGVLAVNGGEGTVHMTEGCFHEVFPDVLVAMQRPSEEYPLEWATWVNGVKFFSLSRDGKWEAQK